MRACHGCVGVVPGLLLWADRDLAVDGVALFVGDAQEALQAAMVGAFWEGYPQDCRPWAFGISIFHWLTSMQVRSSGWCGTFDVILADLVAFGIGHLALDDEGIIALLEKDRTEQIAQFDAPLDAAGVDENDQAIVFRVPDFVNEPRVGDDLALVVDELNEIEQFLAAANGAVEVDVELQLIGGQNVGSRIDLEHFERRFRGGVGHGVINDDCFAVALQGGAIRIAANKGESRREAEIVAIAFVLAEHGGAGFFFIVGGIDTQKRFALLLRQAADGEFGGLVGGQLRNDAGGAVFCRLRELRGLGDHRAQVNSNAFMEAPRSQACLGLHSASSASRHNERQRVLSAAGRACDASQAEPGTQGACGVQFTAMQSRSGSASSCHRG